MAKFTALVLAGACAALVAASGCNRTLPSMEPYDEYKTRLKHPGDIDRGALPVLKPKEEAQTTSPGGRK